MATRCSLQTLSRRCSALLSNHLSHPPFETLPPLPMEILQRVLINDLPNILEPPHRFHWPQIRHFSSASRSEEDEHKDEDEEEEEDEDEDEENFDDAEEDDETGVSSSDEGVSGPVSRMKKEYTEEEKERESATIGYKVLGPLDRSERVFKSYEPFFAVVQVGSHQFKVSNGDCIFTERLKFCEVNEKIILNKVLLLGSCSQTIVGRPTVLDGAVYAIVEEHALDAKVIIFKKKRRKNYRRTKGHRQELTKLRIIDIQGIDRPEKPASEKPSKIEGKQVAA